MNLIQKLLLLIALPALALTFMASSANAFDLFSHCVTQSNGNQICGPCANNPDAPTCQQAQKQGGNNTNKLTGTQNVIQVAANIIAIITGIAAIIVIIISGFRFITSGGSGESAKSARQTLAAAIVGLIIVALAWTITRFITDNLIK
jgi:hypothetical protein